MKTKVETPNAAKMVFGVLVYREDLKSAQKMSLGIISVDENKKGD